MADGIFKNLEVVREEGRNAKGPMKTHWDRWKASSWNPLRRKDNRYHTGANILSEGIRLRPRTTMYYILYSFPLTLTGLIGIILWLL